MLLYRYCSSRWFSSSSHLWIFFLLFLTSNYLLLLVMFLSTVCFILTSTQQQTTVRSKKRFSYYISRRRMLSSDPAAENNSWISPTVGEGKFVFIVLKNRQRITSLFLSVILPSNDGPSFLVYIFSALPYNPETNSQATLCIKLFHYINHCLYHLVMIVDQIMLLHSLQH